MPENFNMGLRAAPGGAESKSYASSLDWESRYQVGDTPWEKGSPAPPLIDWLASHDIRGRVLVPGCGSGHDVRALARAGAEPVGLDLAPSAIHLADSMPRVNLESYCLADYLVLPSELVGTFDWVFEHTCFCAINPDSRAAYVSATVQALNAYGQVLAIFYLNPNDHSSEGPPYGITRAELDALFADHFEIIYEYIPAFSYPGREGRELVRLLRRRFV